MTPAQEEKLERFIDQAEKMSLQLANAIIRISHFESRFDRLDGNLLMLKAELDLINGDIKQIQNSLEHGQELIGALNQIVTGVRSLSKSTFDMVASHNRSLARGEQVATEESSSSGNDPR